VPAEVIEARLFKVEVAGISKTQALKYREGAAEVSPAEIRIPKAGA